MGPTRALLKLIPKHVSLSSHYIHICVNMCHCLSQTSHTSHPSITDISGQNFVGVTIPTYFAANTTNCSHYIHICVNMGLGLSQTSHTSHPSNTAISGQNLVGVTIPTYFAANTTNCSHWVHICVNMGHSLNQTSHTSHPSNTAISGYHQLAIYSQGQQKKINYSAPIKDNDLKF